VVSNELWLTDEYLPEVAALDQEIFPTPDELVAWLGDDVRIEPVLIARDTPDWTFGAFWAHPERVLDPVARANTSGFARLEPEVARRAVAELERDLADGTWDARHGALRELEAFDVGMRLVVAQPPPHRASTSSG
jgi:hypothetical protein